LSNRLSPKEFEQENQRLLKTIKVIDEFIKGKKKPWVGADDWSNHNLQQYQKKTRKKYWAALKKPYFGRVDFTKNGEAAKKYYIGKAGLDLDDYEVIDWRAPDSSLFYGSNVQKQGYKAPNGQILGHLQLKKHIDIQDREISKIQDIVDYRSGDVILTEDANRKFLVDELSKRESPQFQDIVCTG
jgi:DNA helicase IV